MEAWDHVAESRAVSPQPEEPLDNVLARLQTEESPEDMLVSLQTEALLEAVLVAPVLRDERFSGPERVQLATPLAHAEWPDCQAPA